MPKRDSSNSNPSPRQVKVKESLEEAFNEIKLWSDCKPDEIEEMRDVFKHDWQVYERAIRGAIRAGLIDHPLVKEWTKSRRLLGEWDVLRTVKGLEKGVKRPISMEDLKLWDRIRRRAEKHARENKELPTQEQIRKRMYNLRELPKLSRQAFHKLVDRLDLRIYFKD